MIHGETRSRAPQAANGVTALERGLSLIMAIGQREEGLTLSDAARASSLNKTTAFRLLQSLEAFAFVRKTADQRYCIGPALAVLNRSSASANWLEGIVRPYLERLATQTEETASFFVRQGSERLCIACAQGRHSISHSLKVGDRLPLDRGASGKALTQFEEGRPKDYVPEVLYSIGARVTELAAVALPIFDRNGDLLGAISLSGTATRYSDSKYLDTLISMTREVGEKLNNALALGRR